MQARIQELTEKLSRTQETYGNLVAAHEEYVKSAKKVSAAERKLQDHEAAAAGGKVGRSGAWEGPPERLHADGGMPEGAMPGLA